MSHLNPGLISGYNSLTDKHLAGYFSNARIRRHLQRTGLLTRSGRIIPDKEYRQKLIQRAHHRRIRECLAQAIFHKVLELERLHQTEIKRKLEEFERRERVHKLKEERCKRYEEGIIHILSPRPPTGARGMRTQHSGPEGVHSETSESPGSSRPNTAPGKMQRPVRLKPLHSSSTTTSVRRSAPYRQHEFSREATNQTFNYTENKDSRRRLTKVEVSHGISPYCLPVINNFITPVPPTSKKREVGVKVTPSGTLRGRRLRPTTASSGPDVIEGPLPLRSSVHQSGVSVHMVYFGKTVHLSHDLLDLRDDVKVFQQHCGGENLCVYRGKLYEGDTFQFVSRRHQGFPFSLTFFLNGLQVERLSSCCEFKHRKGSRLGGRHGHFGFISVKGASPCYKCIIAVGLDKKPLPPPQRVKQEEIREEMVTSPQEASEVEMEMSGNNINHETKHPQDMEMQTKEDTPLEDDKLQDDYEEDFEADDAEDTAKKEIKSPSPSSKSEKKVRDDSETEDDVKNEDTTFHSGSSISDSDREESDTEAPNEIEVYQKAEQHEDVHEILEQETVPPHENDEQNPEVGGAEAMSAVVKGSDLQDSVWDSTEIEVSDSVPPRSQTKGNADTSGDNLTEKSRCESKQEEEPERAKSVQEKLAEAILKEAQFSSEPELSDTSTEEEEEATRSDCKADSKDSVPEMSSVTMTEQLQTNIEERKCEESVADEVEEVQDQKAEMSELKNATEPGDHHNDDPNRDEKVKKDLPAEKASEAGEEEDRDKKDKSEDVALHPVPKVKKEEDDKTSVKKENTALKGTDAEPAGTGEETEEKTTMEADEQPEQMDQDAKGAEEDESSPAETKNDETAAGDNVEVMMTSRTMEMKVKPSEEQEALSCEEAKKNEEEEKEEEGDSETRPRGPESEVIAENSNGSSAPEPAMIAEVHTENMTRDNSKSDVKDTEASEVNKDDSREKMWQEAQEQKSIELNREIIQDEQTEANNNKSKKDETEEEKNDESVEGEKMMESGESAEDKVDSSTDEKIEEEPIENMKTSGEEEIYGDDTSIKKDEDDREELGEKSDKTVEFEDINDAKSIDDGEEKREKDGIKEGDEESTDHRRITDETVEREELSKKTKEPENHTNTSVPQEKLKIDDKNPVGLKDDGDGESADVAQEAKSDEVQRKAMENEELKETERDLSIREKQGIDAESGESSPGIENGNYKDKAEVSIQDVKTVERETMEVKTVEVRDGEDVKVDQISGSEAKNEDANVDNRAESYHEGSGVQVKDEAKTDEVSTRKNEGMTNNDKNTTPIYDIRSDRNNQTGDLDLMTKAQQKEQFSKPRGNESECENQPDSEEAATGFHLFALDGEKGTDMEDASKASEEGANVLLKTQTRPSNAEEAITSADKESPDGLEMEDNRDLVTNWVTVHQSSRFFQTFVEPLEDLGRSSSDAQVYKSDKEVTNETGSVHQVQVSDESEDKKDGHEIKAAHLDPEISWSEDEKLHEKGPMKSLHKDSVEIGELIPKAQTHQYSEESVASLTREDPRSEKRKGSVDSQDGTAAVIAERRDEVENSAAGEKQTEVKAIRNSEEKCASAEEKSLESRLVSEVRSASEPERTSDTWEKIDNESREVTDIIDFTASEYGSQEECRSGQIQTKASDETVGEKKDEKVVNDVKHTLSKDHVSTYSVEETLLGRSSHSLLNTAKIESGH
ncbi:glutamate-rich protein 3 [Thalassophryne amazonica]|uniref:glutamate-rich protein 3 n=1 Tax=Thalassophryne amazonica TaxID=390379 RepID=UPI0014725701|nr:glutamate-rich protein 3 [Thalassophryne amazonica]